MTEAELAFAFAEQAVKEATELETPDLVLSSAKYAALECFPQAISEHKLLYRLYADRTQVTDLTPIASLTQLKELWLQRTPIHDLSPLTGLLDLEELQLSETNVVDLSPLRSLNSLERLTVNNTHVSSVAVLSEL
ncbi:MAG: leucine-rich repeat domain-containing protein, partial [Pseudomonadota bacterium]